MGGPPVDSGGGRELGKAHHALRSVLPAVVTPLLSIAIVCWSLMPEARRLSASDPRRVLPALLFVAMSVAIGAIQARLRRAKETLERTVNERRVFAALIENSSDFIGISDPAGNAVYVNPAGRRMVGLPGELPIESTQVPEYYPPDVRPFVSDVIMKGIAEQGNWTGETYFRHWLTGQRIPVWDSHFRIDTPDGEVIGIGTITRDLSTLRRARDEIEEANQRSEQTARDLRESQQLLQAVFDHSPNAIVVKSLDGKFLLTNQRFELGFGLKPGALQGKTDYDVLPPPAAERHRAIDETAIKTGKPVTMEETGELKDGTHTYLETIFPLRDEDGTPFGICWIGTEITDIKHTEETLRRTAADLKQAQRVAHIGSWSWDIATNTMEWSEELFRMYGRDPSLPPPSYREEFPRLLTPESMAIQNAAVEKLLRDQKPYEIELEVLLPDGSNRWMAVLGEAVHDASGRLTGIRGTAQDITQLKTLQRMKDEWMSVIAHDLRQPIGVIKMSAELLPDLHAGKIGEKEGAITERIRSAAKGLARMVDDLLDMSRLEAHRLSLEQTWVDPGAIVRDTIERLVHITAGRNITISEGAHSSPVFVDMVRFEQVLGNLISNAVKYGDPKGEIHVHVEQHGSEVEMSVTNAGGGIPPEEVPRVFSRFRRSGAARDSGVPGLGLGLYIAKGLVEAHGGRMWVESTPGEKTSFHFTLPCRSAMKGAA